MGILESCEGNQARMSVSLDPGLFRDSFSPQCSSADYYFKESKMRLFGDIFYKKGNDKTQFVLQTHLVNRNPDVIHQKLMIFEDSAAFLREKGCKIKISYCIEDPNRLDHRLYLVKLVDKPQQVLLKIIPFNRYEDDVFKRGIYELAMLQQILDDSPTSTGYKYRQGYVIESGIDKDQQDKCLVIVGDSATCSLSELLTYRKMMHIPWTEHEFEALCYNLVSTTMVIHAKKIGHRDIRPSNLLYSSSRKGFVLGGLHNAVSIANPMRGLGYNLAGVPYYLPKYLVEVARKEEYSQYYNYDPVKADTYALGLTILNALFLDQFMPPDVLSQSLKKYDTKYPFLRIIRNMLNDNPPPLSEVCAALSQISKQLRQDKYVQGLRFGSRPQDEQFVSRKRVIAGGYYSMFMYDQWVDEISQVVNYYELNHNNMQLGEVYLQIADIYSAHHQNEMMADYYSKAGKVYLEISKDCLRQNKNAEAIKYLEKGIHANRKGSNNVPNADLAALLNQLAMAHHSLGDYEIARAFQEESVDIIAQVHGPASLQYAETLIDSAKIESQFQEFKQAENMLKAGLKIVERKDNDMQYQRVRARLLESLGNNYRMKAIERRDKCEAYRKKAQDCLLDALELAERAEGSIHPQIGSILLNLGNVYFDKREFDKAKRAYEKSLVVKQHTLQGRQNVGVGECLTYIANSQKFLKEYEQAIRHYDEAIEVFRKAYGNDHNENTAVAIGNLGLVYKQIGKKNEEREYLSLAKNILKDLFGEQCPDYQYFDRQMSK